MSDGRNTSGFSAGSRTAWQESSNVSATSNAPHSSAATASVSGVPPSLFWANTLIAGVALAIAITAILVYSVLYRELEREVRLQRLETDEMNVRLALAKIPLHQPGDSP